MAGDNKLAQLLLPASISEGAQAGQKRVRGPSKCSLAHLASEAAWVCVDDACASDRHLRTAWKERFREGAEDKAQETKRRTLEETQTPPDDDMVGALTGFGHIGARND